METVHVISLITILTLPILLSGGLGFLIQMAFVVAWPVIRILAGVIWVAVWIGVYTIAIGFVVILIAIVVKGNRLLH